MKSASNISSLFLFSFLICKHTYAHVYTHTQSHILTCAQVYTCTGIYMHTYMQTYVYMHPHVRVYTHVHIHACLHARVTYVMCPYTHTTQNNVSSNTLLSDRTTLPSPPHFSLYITDKDQALGQLRRNCEGIYFWRTPAQESENKTILRVFHLFFK